MFRSPDGGTRLCLFMKLHVEAYGAILKFISEILEGSEAKRNLHGIPTVVSFRINALEY